MKKSIVIPTYWRRESGIPYGEDEAVYDHPTSLDNEGTLLRCLKSTEKLEEKELSLIVIACATSEEIESQVEERVNSILKSLNNDIILFSYSHLKKLNEFITKEKKELSSLLSLKGYGNIRNLCLLIPHLMNFERVILIDDDELFDDPHYLKKIDENSEVLCLAGYYVYPDGNFVLKDSPKSYELWWNKTSIMNQAFEKFIAGPPRLKEVPFVFGGNMVLRKEVFTKIPFDPNITRGEDIDYLINAKLQGIPFYLDNTLTLVHDPPSKPHPVWKKLREDFFRFLYHREKIKGQVSPHAFDPYPGAFMRDDLEERIFKIINLLSLTYLTEGKSEDAKSSLEVLKETFVFKAKIPSLIENYKKFTHLWQELMDSSWTDRLKDFFQDKVLQ